MTMTMAMTMTMIAQESRAVLSSSPSSLRKEGPVFSSLANPATLNPGGTPGLVHPGSKSYFCRSHLNLHPFLYTIQPTASNLSSSSPFLWVYFVFLSCCIFSDHILICIHSSLPSNQVKWDQTNMNKYHICIIILHTNI